MGREMMGGVRVEVVDASEPVELQVTLGEELTGNTTVLYPMRTGNNYRSTFVFEPTVSGAGRVAEHHEYMEFRYGEIALLPSVQRAGRKTRAPAVPTISVSTWKVQYPFESTESHFSSSDKMLDRIWELSKNTIAVTSLDTATDSNTRERTPYEADTYIATWSRFYLSSEQAWPRHSFRFNFRNPTWPTGKQSPVLWTAPYCVPLR